MQLYCTNWPKPHFASNQLTRRKKPFQLSLIGGTLSHTETLIFEFFCRSVSLCCVVHIQKCIQIKLKLELKLKRRLFNFPAPLSDCRVFSLCEIVPVSHTLLLTKFIQTASTLLYAQETTTAQLRSQVCLSYRLAILNEDRILSND